MYKICFVLPSKNEANTIADVIKDIHEAIEHTQHSLVKIIVADDSRDSTKEIAKSLEAFVINGGGNGLGAAMLKGLKTALQFNPDIIISIDSDGQADLKELPSFLDPILTDDADLVIGSRFRDGKHICYSYPLLNRFGVAILSRIINHNIGNVVTDSHGGIRAMKTEVVSELEMIGRHSYVQETLIDAHEKGFRIVEIESVWNKRVNGQSRVLSSLLMYIYTMLPVLLIRSRMHISLGIPFSIVILLLSIISAFLFNLSVAALLLLISLNILAGSLIIEFLAEIKKKQSHHPTIKHEQT